MMLTVKLMRGGRDDPSMGRYPSSFSRHTSSHPMRRRPASEARDGAPTEVDVARLERDSHESVHGLVRNLFHVGRHLLRAEHHRELRGRSFLIWDAVTLAA